MTAQNRPFFHIFFKKKSPATPIFSYFLQKDIKTHQKKTPTNTKKAPQAPFFSPIYGQKKSPHKVSSIKITFSTSDSVSPFQT